MVEAPVQLAPGVWWVGVHLPGDSFQCHSYLLDHGSDSVLLDPGSPLTIADTLRKVEQVVPRESLRYLVCHHPDPDIAASLPALSQMLERPDVVVVTEWRARALLEHYGHRFDYWLVEEHDYRLELPGAELQFQLTPYLHFPGAFTSFHPGSGTLFSSDLFGGFVGEADPLIAVDASTAIAAARPFHQHYMPSTALLQASLARLRLRWPDIARIAPQHGQIIPSEMVTDAFDQLSEVDCGVFALSDVDHDLQRLLRLAEARAHLVESLLTIADPSALVASLDGVVRHTHPEHRCELFIDLPDRGWTRWRSGTATIAQPPTSRAQSVVELTGNPVALLDITGPGDQDASDVIGLIAEMATSIRPAVDQYLTRVRDSQRIAALSRDALTDPLTGLPNRRALNGQIPTGHYTLLSVDIDHFKKVNDDYGHAAGDAVLREVAAALPHGTRARDHVYRIGGEEFLIVLPDTGSTEAVAIAERLRAAVATLELAGHAPGGTVTISIGAAETLAADLDDFETTLAKADTALYASKDLGRDRVTLALP